MRFVVGTIIVIVVGALLYAFEPTRVAGMILLCVIVFWVALGIWLLPAAFRSEDSGNGS